MAGVTARAVAAAATCLLFAAGPATANGVTFPIAEGVSGPYRYEVGVGPFSPLRKALFVAVTLMADGSPVIDADVTVTVSVDGSSSEIGPLDAANSLTHLATYEVSLELPELAREVVSFEIGVDGRRGAGRDRSRDGRSGCRWDVQWRLGPGNGGTGSGRRDA